MGFLVIYSNYISLIVIIRYLIIKQKLLISTLSNLLTQLSANARSHQLPLNRLQIPYQSKLKLLTLYRFTHEAYTSYSHLYAEMADYNLFWSIALSFLVFSYVLLIAFIIYLLVLSDAAFIVKYVYSCILLFHLILLSTIIKLCGDVLVNNAKLIQMFNKTLAEKTTTLAMAVPMTLKVSIIFLIVK